jgi:hypothetical protein
VSRLVSPLKFKNASTTILLCRKGRHTSSNTKEGGWNRKIRRANEPAKYAPSRDAVARPRQPDDFRWRADSQVRKTERGVASTWGCGPSQFSVSLVVVFRERGPVPRFAA